MDDNFQFGYLPHICLRVVGKYELMFMHRPFVAHLFPSYVVQIQKYLLTVQIQTVFLSPL